MQDACFIDREKLLVMSKVLLKGGEECMHNALPSVALFLSLFSTQNGNFAFCRRG